MDWNNINTDRDTSGLGPIEYDQSKVPALIRKHANNVRTKTYGQEVREAQARNAEYAGLVANAAVGVSNETKVRQDKVETQFNSIQQELTDKDPISAPEIIAARNGRETLSDRLDEAENKSMRNAIYVSDLNLGDEGNLTDKFQEALNTYRNIVIDEELELEADKFPDIRSNTTITFVGDGKLKVKPTEAGSYELLRLQNISNVVINNPVLKGDRDRHLGTTGEWGMGIAVRGSKHVKINNPQIDGFWGDGIYVGRSSTKSYSEDIKIISGGLDNNRRQGMSIVSVKGLYVKGTELLNTNGTPPQAGVDFEPNNADELLQDIVFENVKTYNSGRNGFEIYLNSYNPPTNTDLSIKFIDCVSENDTEHGFYVGRFNGNINGKIDIIRPTVRLSGRSGIRIRSISKNIGKITIKKPVIIDANPTGADNRNLGADISIVRTINDYIEDPEFKMGNIDIINPIFKRSSGIVTLPERISFYEQNEGYDAYNTFENIYLKTNTEKVSFTHFLKNSVVESDNKITLSYKELGGTEVDFPLSRAYYNHLSFNHVSAANLNLRNEQYEREIIITMDDKTENGYKYIRPPAGETLLPKQYASGIRTNEYGARLTLYKHLGQWAVKDITGTWYPVA